MKDDFCGIYEDRARDDQFSARLAALRDRAETRGECPGFGWFSRSNPACWTCDARWECADDPDDVEACPGQLTGEERCVRCPDRVDETCPCEAPAGAEVEEAA